MVPDIRVYYVASIAARIFHWLQHKDTKLLVKMEKALNKMPLSAFPWLLSSFLSKRKLEALPLVAHATVCTCRTYVLPTKLFTPISPLTPAIGNPERSISALVHSNAPFPTGKPQIFHYLMTTSFLKTYMTN